MVPARTLVNRANAAPLGPYLGTATREMPSPNSATLDVNATIQPGCPSPLATSAGGPEMATKNAAPASSLKHGAAATPNCVLTQASRSVGANTARYPAIGPITRIVSRRCDLNAAFNRERSSSADAPLTNGKKAKLAAATRGVSLWRTAY